MSPHERSVNINSGSRNSEVVIDEKSFEIFFRDHFLRFCLYCQFKFGFDTHLAKEVVHTAFIKLWENRYKLDSTAALLPYFQRIVYNNCLDALKNEKTRLRYKNSILKDPQFDITTSSFASADIKQLQADIHNAIAELPAQMQSIFKLSRFEGLKYSEISRQLNISIKTVETQMSRALVKLKQKLGSYLNYTILISTLCAKIFY